MSKTSANIHLALFTVEPGGYDCPPGLAGVKWSIAVLALEGQLHSCSCADVLLMWMVCRPLQRSRSGQL
jgi:hypothetical protein